LTRLVTIFVLALLATVVAATAVTAVSDSETRIVVLADRSFAIPKRYLEVAGEMPWWLRWLPGLEGGRREINLVIDAAELSKAIPAYRDHDEVYRDDVRVLLKELHTGERQQYLERQHASIMEAWSGSGSFSNRIVVKGPDGLFRVYRRVEYPYSWQIFSAFPGSSTTPADVSSLWIGSCLEGSTSLKRSGRLAACTGSTLWGDIEIYFHTSGQNAALIPQLGQFLVGELMQWELEARK
jgi:hypothetical protein